MSSKQFERAVRRRKVSHARLEKPGATVREIQYELAECGLVNPDTGKPWSRATVQRDLDHLSAQAQKLADRDAREWRREELRKLQLLEERALAAEGTQSVHAALAVQRRRTKLLGLDRETPVGSEDTGRMDRLTAVIELIREKEDLSRFDEETWADETTVDLDESEDAPIHPGDGKDSPPPTWSSDAP